MIGYDLAMELPVFGLALLKQVAAEDVEWDALDVPTAIPKAPKKLPKEVREKVPKEVPKKASKEAPRRSPRHVKLNKHLGQLRDYAKRLGEYFLLDELDD